MDLQKKTYEKYKNRKILDQRNQKVFSVLRQKYHASAASAC